MCIGPGAGPWVRVSRALVAPRVVHHGVFLGAGAAGGVGYLKNVALGDIALLTGVDTRTIKKIRAYIAVSNPIHQDDVFLDGFMPLFKVFDLWMNDERYFDVAAGKPRALDLEGQGATFPDLVKAAIQSRGLTSQAVLQRLKEQHQAKK